MRGPSFEKKTTTANKNSLHLLGVSARAHRVHVQFEQRAHFAQELSQLWPAPATLMDLNTKRTDRKHNGTQNNIYTHTHTLARTEV